MTPGKAPKGVKVAFRSRLGSCPNPDCELHYRGYEQSSKEHYCPKCGCHWDSYQSNLGTAAMHEVGHVFSDYDESNWDGEYYILMHTLAKRHGGHEILYWDPLWDLSISRNNQRFAWQNPERWNKDLRWRVPFDEMMTLTCAKCLKDVYDCTCGDVTSYHPTLWDVAVNQLPLYKRQGGLLYEKTANAEAFADTPARPNCFDCARYYTSSCPGMIAALNQLAHYDTPVAITRCASYFPGHKQAPLPYESDQPGLTSRSSGNDGEDEPSVYIG